MISPRHSSFYRFQIGCLLLTLIFLLGAIWYIDFHVTPSMYISDMYTDAAVSVQIWEHKTFLPENWVFGNQLYFCAAPAIAALFYGITGSPFHSMGYASFLLTILQLASLFYMIRPVFRDRRAQLLCLILYLLLPAISGDVVQAENSWQLLFTMCAYYGCYAATAFLCVGLWLRGDQKVHPVLLFLACLFSFATGLQSLRQTLIMTLPLLLTEAFITFLIPARRSPRRARLVFWICGANFSGLAIKHFLHFRQHEIFGSSSLLPLDQIPKAIGASLCTFWRLLAPLPLWGSLILTVFALIFFFLVIRLSSHCMPDTPVVPLLTFFLFSIGAVLGADCLTQIFVREIYYFMLYPFLAVLLTGSLLCFSFWSKAAISLVILLSSLLLGLPNILPSCFQTLHRMQEPEWEISRLLIDQGYTTVYSHWNGCEDLAVASAGSLQAGFWIDEPFQTPVTWLCDPEIFHAPADQSVFVFYGEDQRDACLDALAQAGVSAEAVISYYDEKTMQNVFLYQLSRNILTEFAPS